METAASSLAGPWQPRARATRLNLNMRGLVLSSPPATSHQPVLGFCANKMQLPARENIFFLKYLRVFWRFTVERKHFAIQSHKSLQSGTKVRMIFMSLLLP